MAEYVAPMLRDIRQLVFLVLALGFGVVAYAASGESITRGLIGGLAFATLISAWLEARRRWW